jgi:hypothetical protein
MEPYSLLNDRWSLVHAIAEGRSDEEIVDELLSYDSPVFIDGVWYGPPRQGTPASENRRLILAMVGEIRREMGQEGAPASQRGADTRDPSAREVDLDFSTRLAIATQAEYRAALEHARSAAKQEDAAAAPEQPLEPGVTEPRARGLTRAMILDAYHKAEHYWFGAREPTRAHVVAVLNGDGWSGTSDKTLARAQVDLGIGGWPPPGVDQSADLSGDLSGESPDT